jgi:hypothetical protein
LRFVFWLIKGWVFCFGFGASGFRDEAVSFLDCTEKRPQNVSVKEMNAEVLAKSSLPCPNKMVNVKTKEE